MSMALTGGLLVWWFGHLGAVQHQKCITSSVDQQWLLLSLKRFMPHQLFVTWSLTPHQLFIGLTMLHQRPTLQHLKCTIP